MIRTLILALIFSVSNHGAFASIDKYYRGDVVIDELDGSEDRDDILCLALNVYYEGRGTKEKEQVAIAWVTMNRVNSGLYPPDVCSVVFQVVKFKGKNVHPFQWTSPKAVSMVKDRKAWVKSQTVAYDVYYEKVRDPTNGATSFCRDYVFEGKRNRWCNSKTPKLFKKIGSHYFLVMR